MKNSIYNIPAHLPFSDMLAKWVLEKYSGKPTELSRVLILLPTRRSCLALRDAFLRASNGTPMLLPRMQPIGNVDENILLASGKLKLIDMPPEGFEFRRLFIIAGLVQRYNNSRLDHALKLASELARLFDELEREQVDIRELAGIVTGDFAEHWQVTVEFLKIISQFWPEITREEKITSPMHYRNQMLMALSQYWRETPPEHPIIIAGTTGSIPATAELIACVSQLPQGMIILPGFDTDANEEYLQHMEESHPQWGMYQLLAKMKLDYRDVQNIEIMGNNERCKLLSEVMRPAELSQSWQNLTLDIKKATSGMRHITCSNIQEEATVISLLMRDTVEHKGKTAALVTHDRVLARQVSAVIRRFGLTVDDSAGIPLAQTPITVFLRLIAKTAASNMDAIMLLSLLKHPLARVDMERIEFLEAVREYELHVLRNSTVSNAIFDPANFDISDKTKGILKKIEQIFSAFTLRLSKEELRLDDIISAHVKCAEEISGGELWDGPEAETVAGFLSDACMSATKCNVSTNIKTFYDEIFNTLLESRVFRPEYGGHPRLKILSPIEARMQSFDCVILGGLNEGSWPQSIAVDPWLNRPMRKATGLPSPDRETGLAGHDFFMLANAGEVYLTRSEKIDGTPKAASRWLTKLEVILKKFNAAEAIDDTDWIKIAALLDLPGDIRPAPPPQPRPPLAARPKTMSVTHVETWIRNPYVTYASHILGLYPLQPIMRDLNGSDFGNAIHKAMEYFVNEYPTAFPENARERLLEHGSHVLHVLLRNERVKALWWPRFLRIVDFVIEQEKERRPTIKHISTEMEKRRKFEDFTLKGRADRIEEYQDGISIIDYKTGAVPFDSEIAAGLSNQIILLALIIMEAETSPAYKKIKSLEYWRLKGGNDKGEIRSVNPDKILEYMETAEQGLRNLIAKYNNEDFPYLWRTIAAYTRYYTDYEHLARVKEWS